jgi:hypothetical protein
LPGRSFSVRSAVASNVDTSSWHRVSAHDGSDDDDGHQPEAAGSWQWFARHAGRRTRTCGMPVVTPGTGPPGQWMRLTPRAMTRTDSTIAETDSAAISIFARADSGIVSVGLNAEELVTETYR